MRDIDDPHALAAQFPHRAEQEFDLLLRQRSRRLVHDQHPRSAAQRLGHLDQLLLGHRKRAHLCGGIDFGPHAGEQLSGVRLPLPPIDAPPGARRLQGESDIFPHGELWKSEGCW